MITEVINRFKRTLLSHNYGKTEAEKLFKDVSGSENIEAPFGSGIKLISATLNLNIGCIFFLKNPVSSLIRAQQSPIHLVFLDKTLQFFSLGE